MTFPFVFTWQNAIQAVRHSHKGDGCGAFGDNGGSCGVSNTVTYSMKTMKQYDNNTTNNRTTNRTTNMTANMTTNMTTNTTTNMEMDAQSNGAVFCHETLPGCVKTLLDKSRIIFDTMRMIYFLSFLLGDRATAPGQYE
jgi:hypothetical protein